MKKLERNYFVFSALFFILGFSGCAQLGPYTVDPKVYNSSAQAISESNRASQAASEARKKLQQEYSAESDNNIQQFKVESIYLEKIAVLAAADAVKITDVVELQARLQSIKDGWGESHQTSRQGKKRRDLRLYVKNESDSYTVWFMDPPFDQIQYLGPGETSDFPVEIQEGPLVVNYTEAKVGADVQFYNTTERSVRVFIEKDRVLPITIFDK